MDSEVSELFKVLKCYKNSLLQTLEKTEKNLLRTFNETQDLPTKELIKMEIVSIFPTYLTMIHTWEIVEVEISEKFPHKTDVNVSDSVKRPKKDPSVQDKAVQTDESNAECPLLQEKATQSEKDNVENSPVQEENLEANIARSEASDTEPTSNLGYEELIDFSQDVIKVKESEPKNETDDEKTDVEVPQGPEEIRSPLPTQSEYSSVKGTAVQKLLQMRRYDWREEMVKKHEIQGLKKTLRWELIPKPASSPAEKKPKERRAIFHIDHGELRVDQTCVICHVESPSEFYVRCDQSAFREFEDLFTQNMNQIHQYVVNRFKSKAEARDNLGKFFVGYHPTRRIWYRLEVLDWMTDEEDDIVVQLIDSGEKMFWDYQFVKAMPELCTAFPKMAIKCHLVGIFSEFANEQIVWLEESIDLFTEISEMEKTTEFLVLFVQKRGDSCAVSLRRKDDPNAKSLGQLLVANNHAFEVSDEDSLEKCDEEVAVINEDEDEDKEDDGEDSLSEDAQLGEKLILPEVVMIEEDKEDVENFVSEHAQLVEKLILPVAGQTIKIFITGYVNVCHFYVHILDNRTGDNFFNDNFRRLQEAMQANNVAQSYEVLNCAPRMGEIVLVKDKSTWFRGRCAGCTDSETYQVVLVDFGSSVEKKIDEIRRMKEDFLNVPFQAVECIFHNYGELKLIESQLSHDFFHNVYSFKVFTAHVVESGVPLKIHLWDEKNSDMDIVLEQFGLVQRREDLPTE